MDVQHVKILMKYSWWVVLQHCDNILCNYLILGKIIKCPILNMGQWGLGSTWLYHMAYVIPLGGFVGLATI